jgi:hypothetical protein
LTSKKEVFDMGGVVLPELGATQGILRQGLEDLAKAKCLEDAKNRLLGAGNRTAVRPKSAEEVGIRRVDARVEVRPGTDDMNETCIEVAVYSLMRPGNFKRVLLDRRSPTAAVQIAAGACAEECCEMFGDPFDPSQAANLAGDLLARLQNT